MTTITKLTLSAQDFALAETFEAFPNVELRVKSIVAKGSLQTMPLVWIGNVDRDELEETLATDSTVEKYTCLLEDPNAEERLFRLECFADVTDICGAIYEYDGMILDAQGSNGRWAFRLLFPKQDHFSQMTNTLEEKDVQLDVKRMVDAGHDANLEATAALTDAQEKAISKAYELGYYDVPRRISLEKLANELDISHQALSERLRRANKVLASEKLDESPRGIA